MGERPILFSAPMVRALLDGRKTQTRRILKLPTKTFSGGPIYERPDMGGWEPTTSGGEGCFTIGKDGERVPAPEQVAIWHRTTGICMDMPIQAGDTLWVREAWADLTEVLGRATERWDAATRRYVRGLEPFVWYRADGPQPDVGDGVPLSERWRSPLFMPRWASRLTLTVTDVRVQRLQDIDQGDAIAEGLTPAGIAGWAVPELGHDRADLNPVNVYRSLWEHINGPDSWDANPWVAAYTFTVERRNIDAPTPTGEASDV